MKYSAWSAAHVEARLIEAAQTSMMLPYVGGAGGKSGSWVDYALTYSRGLTWKVRPSPGALSRMDECADWVNEMLVESERKLINAWLYFKTRKGRTVAEYAEKSGMNSKTLRRAVIACCQRIADLLNKRCEPLKLPPIDQVSENLAHESADSVVAPRLERSPTHMMAPDGKPKSDLSPAAARRVARLIERLNKRTRKRRRRKKVD